MSLYKDTNSYTNMHYSGSKGKLNHIISIQHTGILLEGSNFFPRGDDRRHNPYHPVRIGLREGSCVFDGLYLGVNL